MEVEAGSKVETAKLTAALAMSQLATGVEESDPKPEKEAPKVVEMTHGSGGVLEKEPPKSTTDSQLTSDDVFETNNRACSSRGSSISPGSVCSDSGISLSPHPSSSGYSSRSESSDLDSPISDRPRSTLPPKKRRLLRAKCNGCEPPFKRQILHRHMQDTDFKFPHSTGDTGKSEDKARQAIRLGMPINPQRNLQLLQECQLAVRPDSDGDLPLHVAVVQDAVPIIQKIVPLMQVAGVSLDSFNNLKQTPLHLAVITRKPQTVCYLLKNGANPDQIDRHGNTSFHLAIQHDCLECLRELLTKLSPFSGSSRNFEGITALHSAIISGRREFARVLIEKGLGLDSPDGKSGRTALHYAAEANWTDIIQMLLEKGAAVNQQSFSGMTALHVANGRGHMEVVAMLIQHGADTTLRNVYLDAAFATSSSQPLFSSEGPARMPANTKARTPASPKTKSSAVKMKIRRKLKQ